MGSTLSSKSSELNSTASESPRPPRGSALALLIVMLPVAAVVFIVDHYTKNLAETELSKVPGESVQVLGNFLRFSLSHNTGAAFGVLQHQNILYVIIALVVIVVSVGYYRYLPRDNNLLKVCIGMQLGGAVGNLVDRFQHVYVVDFIDVGIGDLRWPWFNVADSCIVVSIIVLAGYLTFHPEPNKDRKGS